MADEVQQTDMDPIAVGVTSTQQDTGISIGGNTTTQMPSANTATARANTFQFGLGNILGKDYADIHSSISTGHEQVLRNQAASTIDAATAQTKQDLVKQLTLMRGAPLTNEDVSRIMAPTPGTDPGTVSEQAAGHTFVDTASAASNGNMKGSDYDAAKNEIPQVVQNIQRDTGEVLGRREYLITKLQDVQDALANESWGGWIVDTLKTFVPGYDELKTRGWVGDKGIMGDLFQGDNLEDQRNELLRMPMPQFKQVIDHIVDKLKMDNPQVAGEYLQAMIGQSYTDKFLNNLQTGLDISSIPGTGLVGKALLRKAALREAAIDANADILRGHPKEPSVDLKGAAANAAGDFQESGSLNAAQTITNQISGKVDPIKEATDSLVSAMRLDSEKFAEAPGAGGQNIANRIKEKTNVIIGDFIDTVKNVARVDRLSDVMATEASVRAIGESIKTRFRGMTDSVSDVVFTGRNPISNTYNYELHLTNPDGTLFKQWIQARAYAKLNGLLDSEVRQEGMGYKIVQTVPLDEHMPIVQELLGKTEDAQIHAGKWGVNGFLGWLRTPKEVLSKEENMQREIATHAPSVLLGLIKKNAKDIQALPKSLPFTTTRGRWADWWRAIDHARHAPDPKTGDPGYFFETGQEMDNHWLKNYQRLPTEPEKEAYFAYKRNIEMNRAFTVMQEYSQKAQWGAQQHRTWFYDKDNKRVNSGFVEGKLHPVLPHGDETIYVHTGRGPGTLYRGNDPKYLNRANLLGADVKSGKLKVMQVWNTELPNFDNFANISGEKVAYLVTDKLETKALDWDTQVNRRGGGHFIYDYEHYIKQARIRPENVAGRLVHWYEGDTTVMPMKIRTMGQDVVRHLNKVQQLLRDGDEVAAKAYNDAHLPIDWEEHKGWYSDSHEGGKFKPARLSLKDPFYLVPNNRSIIDLDNTLEKRYEGTFRDGTLRGNPARQHMVEFTGERDSHEVMTINDLGSRANPLYKYEPAKLVDPITTMNRALNNVVKSTFMNDMKNFSIKHWLKQAAPFLEIKGGENALWHSPFHYFNNADQYWRKAPADAATANTLKAAHHMIQQFNGVPNEVETVLHSITQHLADTIYRVGGPKVVPGWMLSRVKDPAAFVRSVVVHMKLGLFNLPAMFVQASTYANILGIAGPRHAVPGAIAMYLHTLSRFNRNPAILSKLDEYATHFGWRPGEWLEANQELAYRGFRNVGHDSALIDAPYNNKVLSNKWGTFLNAGQAFFREGAEGIRTAAWYTAHHEHRSRVPTGAISKRQWDITQARAADLDHNMSRAANSTLQSGFKSFPTQFLAYPMRLAELMTGKRLTGMEKRRLFATSSILYGLPFGGLSITGLPLAQMIKQNAIDQNGQEYLPGDNFTSTFLYDGLPAAVIAEITGEGDIQAGTTFNISQRYGNKNPLDDVLMGDTAWWKIVGGATSSTFANTFTNVSPLIRDAVSFIHDGGETHPVTADDILQPLQEISSWSQAQKLLSAVHTGHWLSKNGTYMSDITKGQAIFQAVTGLTEARTATINDTFNLQQAEKANYAAAEKEAIVELRRYHQSLEDNDPEQAGKYMVRAKAIMDQVGYPLTMRHQVYAAASKGFSTSLLRSADENYFLGKSVPQGEQEERQETYRRIQNLNEKQGQQ